MVTNSGILDWIEDGRGRDLDGSPKFLFPYLSFTY